MADVVVRLGHADVEAGIAWNTEFGSCGRRHPSVSARQFVLAAAASTFHDFSRTGIESEGGGQHHTNGFFGAIRKGELVADAFAVKENAGLGGDGNVAKSFCCHDF